MLLDEVGTGTDPAQGAALGVALLQALVKGGQRGSGFTMATTHHRSISKVLLDLISVMRIFSSRLDVSKRSFVAIAMMEQLFIDAERSLIYMLR